MSVVASMFPPREQRRRPGRSPARGRRAAPPARLRLPPRRRASSAPRRGRSPRRSPRPTPHRVVEELVEDRRRQLARMLHGDAVGDRVAGPAACTPTTRTSGRSACSASAMPAASPPPPIGMSTVSASGSLLGELEPDRPLPGITRSSSNACTNVAPVRSTWLGAPPPPPRRCSRPAPSRPVAASRLDLRHRRVLRNEDRRARSRFTRGPGDRLRRGCRRSRRRRPPALGLAERRERVDGATDLERAGALQVLCLQPHFGPVEPREVSERVNGCDAGDAVEALAGALDVSQRREWHRASQHLLEDLADRAQRIELAPLRPAPSSSRRARDRRRRASRCAPRPGRRDREHLGCEVPAAPSSRRPSARGTPVLLDAPTAPPRSRR